MTAADLPILFEQQRDPDANHMAAFTSRDPHDWPLFVAHWQRILADPTVLARTIVDDGVVVGNIGKWEHDGRPEVTYWIGREHWGRGIATRALGELLRLYTVRPVYAAAAADNVASRRVLEKCGFAADGDRYAITADGWRDARDGPAIERLHPGLKAILDEERAAGNEVMESSVGWPDAGSVFVRLRHPFRTVRREMPKGVRFTQVNDPHWWTAEYATESPRHVLAC